MQKHHRLLLSTLLLIIMVACFLRWGGERTPAVRDASGSDVFAPAQAADGALPDSTSASEAQSSAPANAPAAPPVAKAAGQATPAQKLAFQQLQQLLAGQSAAAAHSSGARPLGVAASSGQLTPKEAERKIQHHLSGAWRDSRSAPSSEYFFRPVATESGGEGFEVENPNHRLAATLDGEGVSVRANFKEELELAGDALAGAFARDWQVHLRLTGVGYEGAVQPAGSGEAMPGLNHLEWQRPGLTEWFVNNGTGLEHGFTLEEPRRDVRPRMRRSGWSWR